MLPVSQSIGVLSTAVLVVAAGSVLPAADKVPEPQSALSVTVSSTLTSPTLGQVNRGTFEVVVTVENTSRGDLVLWPFLSLEVLDAKEKPVDRSQNIGRWGDLDNPCMLEAIRFVKLPAGKAHEFRVRLNEFADDAEAGIMGWQLPGSGEYRLVLRYQFDRAAAKKRYGAVCQTIDDPDRPWNRAIEIDKTEKLELRVKP